MMETSPARWPVARCFLRRGELRGMVRWRKSWTGSSGSMVRCQVNLTPIGGADGDNLEYERYAIGRVQLRLGMSVQLRRGSDTRLLRRRIPVARGRRDFRERTAQRSDV